MDKWTGSQTIGYGAPLNHGLQYQNDPILDHFGGTPSLGKLRIYVYIHTFIHQVKGILRGENTERCSKIARPMPDWSLDSAAIVRLEYLNLSEGIID